ncbi:hypothetical protein ACFQE8_19545 [Salinirubellus sp. GCM10025818]|uniref:DUF7289 family protein n=1 Tax=Salinirubellus TaxID=2162630 RepID=UPI0030CEEE5F
MTGRSLRSGTGRGGRDRGASEILGFVLLFALIVGSTGLVFTAGFDALEGVQTDRQNENAESAFLRIATKFQQIGDDGAPLRAGDLSVSPAGLSTGGDVELTVTVHLPSGDESRTFQVGALSYTLDDTAVAYEANAVFRSDGDGVAVLSAPPWKCRAERTVISFTAMESTGPTSVASDSVTVVGEHEDTSLWFPFDRTGAGSADDATGVSVAVDSPNSVGWNRYFEDAPGWADPEDDGTYRCATDRVYVRQVNVTTRLV